MKTQRGIPAFYQQPWMQEPQSFTAETTYDDKRDVLEFVLPNGSVVGLSYEYIQLMIAGIESRKLA